MQWVEATSHPERYPGRPLTAAERGAVRGLIRRWRRLMERLARL